MVDRQTIDKAVNELIAVAKPERIILFGSYARNEATDDSDIDLLVIMPDIESTRKEMVRLRRCLAALDIPIDSARGYRATVPQME